MNAKLQAHLDWFAALSPASLARIDDVYDAHARFSDPFQQLQGRAAIGALYGRMFERLQAPNFEIVEVIAEDSRAFVCWDFNYGWRGRQRRLHGGSLLRLGADGLIVEHADYWDAASGIYEQIPLLGAVLRGLRRRMA